MKNTQYGGSFKLYPKNPNNPNNPKNPKYQFDLTFLDIFSVFYPLSYLGAITSFIFGICARRSRGWEFVLYSYRFFLEHKNTHSLK
jgi:hypothetical protein